MHRILIICLILLLTSIANCTLLIDMNPLAMPRKNKLTYFLGIFAIVAISTLFLVYISPNAVAYSVMYPLLVYVPLVWIFKLVSKYDFIQLTFVILTGVFFAFPASIVLKLAGMGGLDFAMRSGIYLLSNILFSIFIYRFVRKEFIFAMHHCSKKDIMQFCVVPLAYTVIGYIFGYYELRMSAIVIRIVLFLSIAYVYYLILGIVRRSKEMSTLVMEKAVMKERVMSAERHLYDLRATQEQSKLYRHDLRHHVALIAGYIKKNDSRRAKDYITQIVKDIDSFTPVSYCNNITINLLLAFFVSKAEKKDIQLSIIADVPDEVGIAETSLCAIISNGLENALQACEKTSNKDLKRISFRCNLHTKASKLLIMIENNYEAIESVNSEENLDEHGFGIKSIESITEKLGGVCSFKDDGELFNVKILLPVKLEQIEDEF